ncbi:multidrug MFS transporter [Rhodococcus pyridinivorans SB3094]|uniref:Multidrug MFS transporter n=1 Tax=Rhodococcus pyridinivorans SB3094 TaxID=1435356 RepID=V9XDJ4_9NOCA|nr:MULTISPECIES: MFS transporter [Rhodococcus]AHD20070.1 multidrug MFS transporter [Rhodococcus pyridinivorans SB3094]MCT7292207.1 MFS transporter [Rhodococcus sp. PAE-6]
MTTSTPARSTATKRITLLVVCVTTAMLMLDIAVVNTALPSIAVDLDAGVSSLQWVIDAYTLALATAVLGAGSWADRRGRRQVFVVGLVWFTGASLLCALAPTIWVLDLARAVQGIGGAVLFACSLALLADVFDRGRARASALAAYGATIGGAFAVGPLVGGLLTELLDWRAIFFVNVPIGLVTLLLTLRWVPESRDPRPRAADVPGQLLAAVGLAAFVFAVLRGHEIGWSDAQAVIAFVLAVGALVAFVAHEMRTAEPMLPPYLLANRAFVGAQVAAFAISASLFAVFVYTTLYLQNVLLLSPVQAGLVYLPATVAMFVVAGATAKLDRVVPAWVSLSCSLALVAVGLLMMTVAEADSSKYVLLPGLVVACAAAGVFNPAMSGIVLGESTAAHSGLAAGINDAFRQTGIAVGVAVLGMFLPAESLLPGGSPQDFVSGLQGALVVAAFVAALGTVVCAVCLRPRPQTAPVFGDAESDTVELQAVTG